MTKKIKKFLFTVNFPVDGLKNLQDYEIDWLFSLAEQYEIDKLELARAIADTRIEESAYQASNSSRKKIIIEFKGEIFQTKKALADRLGRSVCSIDWELKKPNSAFKIIGYGGKIIEQKQEEA